MRSRDQRWNRYFRTSTLKATEFQLSSGTMGTRPTEKRRFNLGELRENSTYLTFDTRAGQDVEPIGNGYKFGERRHLHLLHDAMAVSLDGTLRGT